MRKDTFIRNNRLVTRSRDSKGRFVRGDFERLNIYTLITQLEKTARKILDEMFLYVDYNFKLGNLIDSTACAVYVDGELVEDTIMYATEPEISIAPSKYKEQSYAVNSGKTGRQAIDDWFSDNKTIPAKKNTVHLVVIAAMHYGYYLETGSYGGPQIQVISGFADAIEDELFGIANEAGYKPSMQHIAGIGEWNF